MTSSGTGRRYFLKRLGISCAGIVGAGAVGFSVRDRGRDEPLPGPGGAGPQFSKKNYRSGLSDAPPFLAVGTGNPTEATNRALRGAGGIGQYVRTGETVVIKPNIGWDRAPLLAANTNPSVVAAVVAQCLAAGASRVVVTDNPCNEPQRAFTRSGIWKAVTDAGGEVILPAPHRFAPVQLGGKILGQMPVLLPAVQADRFINMPVAKHHGLTGLSGAMKNLYGILGGRRNRLHQKVDESIVDLTAFVGPTLTVMDATRVLIRNGPQGGSVADTKAVGEVIVGVDPVAIDTYACGLIGLTPDAVPHIGLAAEKGLGTMDLSSISIERVSG